jgi:hypothetical protein
LLLAFSALLSCVAIILISVPLYFLVMDQRVASFLLGRVAWLQVVSPDMLVRQGDMRSLRVQEVSTVLPDVLLLAFSALLSCVAIILISVPLYFLVMDQCILIALAFLLGRVAWLQVVSPDMLVRQGDMRSLFQRLSRVTPPASCSSFGSAQMAFTGTLTASGRPERSVIMPRAVDTSCKTSGRTGQLY